MTEYLNRKFDWTNPDLVAAYDELSLWSAMAGLLLLEHVPLRPNIVVLDVGCGTGFPMLELAARLGDGSLVTGLDPWKTALDRSMFKARVHEIKNVQVHIGEASAMPWKAATFDLIVSNLGINNFADRSAAFKECSRLAKPGAVIALTTNLQGHMSEFYEIYKSTLLEMNLADSLARLESHIRHRATIDETNALLKDAGFTPTRSMTQTHVMRFANGTAFLRHGFIVSAFMKAWREIIEKPHETAVFDRLEVNLNRAASDAGELRMTVPFAYIEAHKPIDP
jgi:arsenite methyltransferase